MVIEFDQCRRVDFSNATLERLEQLVLERVADPSALTVILSADFAATVRARTTDPIEKATYGTDRGFGEVGAKTLQDGNQSVIVFQAPYLAGPRVEADGERVRDALIAHESHHVTLQQRGETLSDIRVRHDLSGDTAAGLFLALAGIAAEEYRVDLALFEEGLGWAPSQTDSLGESLPVLRDAFLRAITLRYSGEPIDRPFRDVLAAFRNLVVLAAYVAAADVGTGGRIAPSQLEQGWERLIGPQYAGWRGALESIPSAAQALPRTEGDRLATSLVPLLSAWLRHIGFTMEDTYRGLYFDVLRWDF